uniref:DUF19 domain-containing protein n=2 Tax=Caenorhabditis tropicalis TaxID=1561998 RepID=A0A1I7UK92_9PELO
MKKSTKLCLILNISCCTCILIIVGSIVAIYTFGLQSKMPDPGYCTRKHAAIAMECAKKDDELGAAAASLNHTEILLRQTKDYEPLGGLCFVTLQCAREIKCRAIRNILNDISICGFVYYYTKEFSECANRLYEKRNEIPCLGEIFNEQSRTPKEACKKWKSINPCVKEAIRNECDDRLGILQFKWEQKSQKANSIYCEEDRRITLGSEETTDN